MGDHIAIMKDGEFVQVGSPEDVVAHPVDDYVREFSEDVPRHKVLTDAKVMNTFQVIVATDERAEDVSSKIRENQAPAVFVVVSDGSYLSTIVASTVLESSADTRVD